MEIIQSVRAVVANPGGRVLGTMASGVALFSTVVVHEVSVVIQTVAREPHGIACLSAFVGALAVVIGWGLALLTLLVMLVLSRLRPRV